jgi:hypothetical protein
MSDAKKCNRCGGFYEPQRGCLAIPIIKVFAEDCERDDPSSWSNWGTSDFCVKCSTELVDFLGWQYGSDEKPEAAA